MRTTRFFLISIIAMLLSACTVQLISNFNSSMVNQLQTIQQQINTILITDRSTFGLKKAAPVTSAASKFINIQVVMTDMLSTARAISNNETTIKQLLILQKSIAQLIALKAAGFKSKAEITLLIATINDDFTSVYELQDLKRSYLKTGVPV
jgi:hypothetical protein